MPDTRPTILLCWGYERKGWIEPFEKLNHKFNFTYLFHISKPENEVRCTENKVIYWGDYATPFEILEEIRPGKVIFMGIYIPYTIALNLASKQQKIPTYVLHHGIAQEYAIYHQVEKLTANNLKNASTREQIEPEKLTKKKGALMFLVSAFTVKDFLYLPKFAVYIYFLRNIGRITASKLVWLPQRIPDFYVCYTKKNATLHFQTDKPDESKMIYIGNPEFDKFFGETSVVKSAPAGKYFLFIDQPVTGNQHFSFGISREQMNEVYLKLATFCQSQGARLVVKLHPDSYSDSWQIRDKNIVYSTDETNFPDLIKNAEGCFGIYSTLLIPAVYFKPVIILRLLDSSFQQHLIRLEVVYDIDFFDFQPEDIDFGKVKMLGEQNPEFVEDYFLKHDGKALNRLADVLES